MTSYNNQEDTTKGMTSDVYFYNLENEECDKAASVDYTSQYPLAVFDEERNFIYYSAYVQEKKGDQLFCLDCETGELRQLTDQLFAINYIIPSKEAILLVAVEQAERILRAYLYQKETSQLLEVKLDVDFGVEMGSYDPYRNTFLISGRMETEEMEAVEQYNIELERSMGELQSAIYKPPNYTIYEIELNGEYKELYQTSHESITGGILCDENGLYFFVSGSGPVAVEPLPIRAVLLEEKEKKTQPLTWIDDIPVRISQAVKYKDNLYILGGGKEETYPWAVYCYNVSDKTCNLIFKAQNQDVSYINNLTLVFQ